MIKFVNASVALATIVALSSPAFAAKKITNEEQFKQQRFELRKKITAKSELSLEAKLSQGRAPIAPNDRAEELVDNGKTKTGENAFRSTLATLTRDKNVTLEGENQPWSDTYWPLYQGSIAVRYAETQSFDKYSDLLKFFNGEIKKHQQGEINYSADSVVANLSPAEKYDLLVGDNNFTLTKTAINSGAGYGEKVEQWMGICHGWAPAAYMLNRPEEAVKVKGPSGVDIVFYPSDIKALASMLWANSAAPTRFIGGRCNEKDVADGDENCADTNPGTLLKVLVNQLKVSKRPFIMDATASLEVWNQPVLGYKLSWQNPVTQEQADSAAKARTARAELEKAELSGDDRAKKRAERRNVAGNKYTQVAGLTIDVTYLAENSANHDDDYYTNDEITTVVFSGDVELTPCNNVRPADKGNCEGEELVVTGGEWYTDDHPDFLWTPAKGDRAVTSYEPNDENAWSVPSRKLPDDWQTNAASASSANSSPLAAVVEKLIQFSRR